MRSPFSILAASFVVAMFAGCAATDGDASYDVEGDSPPEGASIDPLAAPGLGVPASLGLDKRHILYLTFDDGPNPATTPRVLDTLRAHGAHATFFLTGDRIRGNEAIVRREWAEGHMIGSHQQQHVVGASLSLFRTWVPLERDTIDAVVGERVPRFFRYPGGNGSTAKQAILRAEGYDDGGIGWDIDSLDWCFQAGRCARQEVPVAQQRDFLGYLYAQTDRRGGGVILFHDIWSNTANRLDAILTHFEERGYTFGALPTEGR